MTYAALVVATLAAGIFGLVCTAIVMVCDWFDIDAAAVGLLAAAGFAAFAIGLALMLHFAA